MSLSPEMKIVMKKKFGGVWPALLTPMTAEGKPALPVLEQLVDLYVQQGLDGLYITGSTGQWLLMSVEERTAVMERVIKAANGRIPVMAHVGAANTADSVLLAKAAAKFGADAVSAVAPIYYGHSEAVVFEHYRQIGQATDLPFYVYHLSSVNPSSVGAKSYLDKLLSVPNLAGMKITDVNLFLFGVIQSGTGGKLQLFSGADEVMCQAVVSGAIGAIGTFYNVWGPVCRQARQAMVDGQIDVASKFMLRFQSAIARVLDSGGIWAFLRAAMKTKYQIDIGMPKPPLGSADKPWDEGQVREVLALVDEGLRA